MAVTLIVVTLIVVLYSLHVKHYTHTHTHTRARARARAHTHTHVIRMDRSQDVAPFLPGSGSY